MCTAVEAASHGQDCSAGGGSHTATARPTIPAPTEIATVSSCLSVELFSRAFQPACSRAAPSTASVTAREISCMPRLDDHLLDQRAHPLDRGAPFDDRLLGAMELHGAEIRQQGRDHDVGRLAGEAAARHLHLADVQRWRESLED